MELNELLRAKQFDPSRVLVLRHRPWETSLNRVLPWLAADRPELFNAYQQTQGAKLEKVMQGLSSSGFIASFLGLEAGNALFVGLYSIGSSRPLTFNEYWKVPHHLELKGLGMSGFTGERRTILQFAIKHANFYPEWKGKLVVGWPPPERSWWRRAHRNQFPVRAIHEESALARLMPDWSDLNLRHNELAALPTSWKAALSQWRGIYFILDESDGKGYVGSAYGKDNLLGRWTNYTALGHGGNRLLKKRDPSAFRFSILQLVSPGLDGVDVIRLENTWKTRLHTRAPHGLNDN